MWKDITEKEKNDFNKLATHPLQSYEWGAFREKTGVEVIRKGFFKNSKLTSAFQLTIHKIPHTKYTIGYLAKGTMPDEKLLEELQKIGKEYKCVFIQMEPNVRESEKLKFKTFIKNLKLEIKNSYHPLFTKYTLQLDITKTEDELLKNMHPKTRYNIRVAQKHGVEIVEDNSDNAFEHYWKIMEETTSRQKFYAHSKKYHNLQWEIFSKQKKFDPNQLGYHLFLANYTPSAISNKPLTLAAWVLFSFHDTLYYPYGSSTSENREVMASNLMMWEAIKFGKKLGLKTFDMWGALGPDPDTKDPWYGFHRFKLGYGSQLVEFVGSYDLIINKPLYELYKLADKLRWGILKLKK